MGELLLVGLLVAFFVWLRSFGSSEDKKAQGDRSLSDDFTVDKAVEALKRNESPPKKPLVERVLKQEADVVAPQTVAKSSVRVLVQQAPKGNPVVSEKLAAIKVETSVRPAGDSKPQLKTNQRPVLSLRKRTTATKSALIKVHERENTDRPSIANEVAAPQPAQTIASTIHSRGIASVFHFTRIENLSSILNHGILSREAMAHASSIWVNDHQRYDGQLGASCFTISFPNYKMFYLLRSQRYPGSDWVVIELDARMLIELDCAFYPTNAANSCFAGNPAAERNNTTAFEQLFSDEVLGVKRFSGLSCSYPTDPQAEVLVFSPVPKQYIKAVHFNSPSKINNSAVVQSMFNRNNGFHDFIHTPELFLPRCDYSWHNMNPVYH